jgi:hypothetical protein
MRTWRKETTACQEAMEACLEKAKAGLEEMEATMDVYEERLISVDTTEANGENSEAIVVHQEVRNEEATVEIVGAQEDQLEDQRPAMVYHNTQKRQTRGDFTRGVPTGLTVEKR